MKEWKEVKLGDILELHYGKGLRQIDRIEGDVPVYSSAGLTGWHNQKLIESEGIIVGRKGTIGSVFYSSIPFWCIDTAYYILPKPDSYSFQYAFYLLKNLRLNELNEDSAVPGLNRNTAYSQEILLPPLKEQKAIAEVLSNLDDKIELLQKQNETLEQLAETLFRQWFIEEAEEDWEEMSSIINVQNGYAFKGKEFNKEGENGVIKIKNISKSNIIVDIINTEFIKIKPKENFKLKSGDVVIAMTGAEIGKLGIIPITRKPLYLNQRVGLLDSKFDGASYLALLYFKSPLGKYYIESLYTGCAQPNISATALSNCLFPKIKKEEMIRYSRVLQKYFNKIIFNASQIQTLSKMRDTLLPKLMSGEVRVKIPY